MSLPLLVAIAMVLAAFTGLPRSASAAPIIDVAIDADVIGNTATSLGTTEKCVSATVGDRVQVDIVVRGVPEYDVGSASGGLAGFGATIAYDRAVLRVVESDYDFFIFADPPAIPISLGDGVPDQDGLFTLGIADFGAATEHGEGIAARVTFEVIGGPYSLLRFAPRDALSTDVDAIDAGLTPYEIHASDGVIQVSSECGARQNSPGDSGLFLLLPPPILLTPATGWNVHASGNRTHLLITFSSPQDMIEIEMEPAPGQLIQPGDWPYTRPDHANPNLPLFVVLSSLDPSWSMNIRPSVKINDVTFDDEGAPMSLSLSFADSFSSGEVRFHSDDPLVSVAHPSAYGLTFIDQALDFDSAPITVSVTNESSLWPVSVGAAIVNDYENEFRIATNSCPASLTAGESCDLDIIFHPVDSGSASAELQIIHGPNRKYTLRLDGYPSSPTQSLSPSGHDFGSVLVGSTQSFEFRLKNTDEDLPARIYSLNWQPLVAGRSIGEYQTVTDGCSGRILNPGQDCWVTVSYTPLRAGQLNARLTILSTFRGSVRFNVSGTAVIPTPTPTPDPNATASPSPTPTPTPRPSRAPAAR